MNLDKIVSNCPLCEEHSLHVIGGGTMKTQQCISCGYATSDKFNGTREDNEMYKTLPEEMQSWSKEINGNIWIPSMITLPFGTLYPINIDGEMKWAYAEMVDIPEEEQKNYPKENGTGNHTKRYDTDNQRIFDQFLYAMAEMNAKAKADGPSDIQPQ
tara:strand:+ start:1970 stop:2440 length:471 start_codon:yes stop_codon:yes gene_type:complete